MWWLVLLLITPAFAQVDLSAIQELDEELPNFTDYKQTDEEISFQRQHRRFLPPHRVVKIEEIKNSGVSYGAIPKGEVIRSLENNQNYKTHKLMYVKYFNLEDEHGFKYIVNQDGSTTWRVRNENISPIKEELALYVPPTRYTPAPLNIVRTEYDKKLKIAPEFTFYTGVVQGDFMADLFEDNKAKSGMSNQFGLHFFTEWKLPVKAGAVVQYERASYKLDGGGQVQYYSLSFGPQIKTREFEIFTQPLRFQLLFKVSPMARAEAETIYGNGTFKFNSADVMAGVERPIENRLGEFVLGLYFQSQWLNLKDQDVPVSLRSSNKTNKSFGLSLGQVF